MKIVINTNYKSAGTKICVDDLTPRLVGAGHSVSRNDWGNYGNYNLALFMAPDSEARKAKKQNDKIITGIMDPKLGNERMISEIKAADFLVVSSFEQRDILLKHNRNIFIYYMFPDIEPVMMDGKNRKAGGKLIIGYHGNKVHLNCASELVKALDELAGRYDMEFWAIYNIEKLGKWKANLPSRCPVKHIQWSDEAYQEHLSHCDIGVIPALIPIRENIAKMVSRKLSSFIKNDYHYDNDDYLLRFKYSNSPGRLYPFSRFSIPVVADFTPSYCQIIQDGISGFLVRSKEGWRWALERLINDQPLRENLGANLKKSIDDEFSIDSNLNKLNEFILTFFK